MQKRIPVPDLEKKLDLLLRYDTVLTKRTALAAELRVHSSQISKWQTGGDYPRNRDMVPRRHFDRLLEIFNVSDEWMETKKSNSESKEQYDSRLEMVLRARTPRSKWQNLFLEAEVCDRLSIKRSPGPAAWQPSFRGLVPENRPDEFLGECFSVGTRVYVELNVSTPWERQGDGPIAYLDSSLHLIRGHQR